MADGILPLMLPATLLIKEPFLSLSLIFGRKSLSLPDSPLPDGSPVLCNGIKMLPVPHPHCLLSVHHKMLQSSCTSGCNDRNRNCIRDRSGKSISYPALVPSQSILVRRISPAPSFSTFLPTQWHQCLYPVVRHVYRYSSRHPVFSWHRLQRPRTGFRTSLLPL